MPLVNPWNSYRQIATQTASPGVLVLMLYEGAIRFLEKARTGFGMEDPAESNVTINDNVQRAQAIISELDTSLNLAEGGEVAMNLRQLYHYFDRRLQDSNLRKDPSGIEEVVSRLTILRDAWSQMLSGQRHSVMEPNFQAAVA